VLPFNPTKNLELKTHKVVSALMNSSTAKILGTTGKPWLGYVTFSGGFLMGGCVPQNSGRVACPKFSIPLKEKNLRAIARFLKIRVQRDNSESGNWKET
jgi:hypothetical protein